MWVYFWEYLFGIQVVRIQIQSKCLFKIRITFGYRVYGFTNLLAPLRVYLGASRVADLPFPLPLSYDCLFTFPLEKSTVVLCLLETQTTHPYNLSLLLRPSLNDYFQKSLKILLQKGKTNKSVNY